MSISFSSLSGVACQRCQRCDVLGPRFTDVANHRPQGTQPVYGELTTGVLLSRDVDSGEKQKCFLKKTRELSHRPHSPYQGVRPGRWFGEYKACCMDRGSERQLPASIYNLGMETDTCKPSFEGRETGESYGITGYPV